MLKLGKRAPVYDPKTPMLAHYMTTFPNPRVSNMWGAREATLGWSMSLNDELGDCVVAGMAHAVDTWTSDIGQAVQIADRDTLDSYCAISGYQPQYDNMGNLVSNETDTGCVEIEALRYWKNTGIAGHKIEGYASIEHQNIQHVKYAIDWFGGVFVGAAMPNTCDPEKYNYGKVWSVIPNAPNDDGKPGSWGGHCVWAVGYNSNWVGVISWATMYWVTWAWWLAYVDEAYGLLSLDWLNKKDQSPAGLNLAGLKAAMATL